MVLQVQQEQLKNPFVRQKRVCDLLSVKLWKSTILCLGPSLISVEINMKKSNGFSLELPTDLIF